MNFPDPKKSLLGFIINEKSKKKEIKFDKRKKTAPLVENFTLQQAKNEKKIFIGGKSLDF